MCAAVLNDSETKRFVDRIQAVMFQEARDAGVSFIARSWIALRLGRSEDFVKYNWNKSLNDCETKFAGCRLGSCHRKKSSMQLSQEIQQRRGKTRSQEVIRLFRQR